jgi:uncharacterized protein YkwD
MTPGSRASISSLALLLTLLVGCAVELPRGATQPGACDRANDSDGDCVPDPLDRCSHTPTAARPVWENGAWAGCAAGQLRDADDGDRDGVPNDRDRCPQTPSGWMPDVEGCAPGEQQGGPPPTPNPDAGAPAPPPPPKDAGAPPPPQPDTWSPPPAPDLGAPKPDTTNNGGLQLTAAEQDLVDAINQARQQNGLNALVPEAKLMCAARKAAAAGGACGHSAGGSIQDRSMQCGFSYNAAWKVNEIATGPNFKDGADCVWGWKQSSGHWWGLVHPQATTIGVARNSKGCFWAMFDCCIKGS